MLHTLRPNPVSDVWQRYSEFLRTPPELTARTFSYLMEADARPEANAALPAVERTITNTLDQVRHRNARSDAGLLAATLGLALDRVS